MRVTWKFENELFPSKPCSKPHQSESSGEKEAAPTGAQAVNTWNDTATPGAGET